MERGDSPLEGALAGPLADVLVAAATRCHDRRNAPVLGGTSYPPSARDPCKGSSLLGEVRYVRNNPLRYIDPSGHAEVEATTPAASPSPGASFELKHDASGAAMTCTTAGCDGKGAAAKDLFPTTLSRDGKNWALEIKAFGFTAKLKAPSAWFADDTNQLIGQEAGVMTGWAMAKGAESGLNWLVSRPEAFSLYSRFAPRGAYILTHPTLSRTGLAGMLSSGRATSLATGLASRLSVPTMMYPMLLQASPSYQRHLEEQAALKADETARQAIGSEDFMSAD